MYLKLNHQNLDVYHAARNLVTVCYKATATFPNEEKYALSSQLRRCATSIYLNLAEGCSRRSTQERKRFFEIARASLVELDAALDLAEMLGCYAKDPQSELAALLLRCFEMLSALIRSCK